MWPSSSTTSNNLKGTILFCVSLMISLIPQLINAQETNYFSLPLEELLKVKVTSVSKKEERIEEAPGIVSVVTRKEIDSFAARSLGEVLNRVVGASFLTANAFAKNVVSIRGQSTTPYNNHVLLLLNGRPLREPASGGLNAGIYNAFPIDSIDHIEIIRGPGSVLYGSNAYSGVINIVTREKTEKGVDTYVSAGYGSFESYSQQAGTIFKTEETSGFLAVNNRNSDGPSFRYADTAGLIDSDDFSEEAVGVVGNVAYEDLHLDAYMSRYNPYSLDPGHLTWDKENADGILNLYNYFINLGYDPKVSDSTSLDFNVTFNKFSMHNFPQGELATAKGEEILFEGDLKTKISKNLHLLAGSTFSKTVFEGSRLINGRKGTYSIYSQVDYQLSEMFKLVLGLQWNKIDSLDDHFSPRLGIIANFTEEIGAKLLYSTAFRKAYPWENYFEHPVFKGNPAVEPELIDTMEAELFYNSKKAQLSLSAYRSEMSDIILRRWHQDATSPFGGFLRYENGGEHDFWGIELDGKYHLTDSIFVVASASYQENENDDDIDDASLHPNEMLKVGVIYDRPEFDIGIFNSYFGAPEDVSVLNPSVNEYNKEPNDYSLLSAKISLDMEKIFCSSTIRGLSLLIEGDNLLDEDIRYPEYTSRSINSLTPLRGGRSGFVSLRYEF